MSSRSARGALRVANVTSLLAAFVATAMVMGLVAAGLLMPAVAFTGKTSQQMVQLFEEQDAQLDENPLAQQSRILAADGSLIVTPADENRIVVESEDISQWMKRAQVAIEDERFYEHGGVDLQGLARALVLNRVSSGGTQGGSTLTQQYVKLRLLQSARDNEDHEALEELQARSGRKGYIRKIKEARYAVALEQEFTKDEILTAYLNTAYYGDRAYGVEAAARHYFGIPAKKLSIAQAATLAGIVQLPGVTDPINNPERALARRNLVLAKMRQLEMINDNQLKWAQKEKMNLKPTFAKPSCAGSDYPYFCTYVMQWLLTQPALGDDPAERRDRLYKGGLTVQTTLDPKLVREVEKDLMEYVPKGNDARVGAAAAVVEPGTGKVLAIGQNTTFNASPDAPWGEQELNWAVDSRYGGGIGFQFGSTAKFYTIVTALMSGFQVDDEITVRPAKERMEGKTFNVAEFTPTDFPNTPCGSGLAAPWLMRNSSGHYDAGGTWSLKYITMHSINTAFGELGSQLDLCKIQDTMGKMGLHHGYFNDDGSMTVSPQPASLILGADNADPVTMAASYATAAARGMYCEPRPVAQVKDAKGKVLLADEPKCTQAIDPNVAAGVSEIFTSVFEPTGSGDKAVLDGGRPAAGKTGTTDSAQQLWFVGYTPQLSTAVWVGLPFAKAGDAMINITIGERRFSGVVYAGDLAAPIWKEIMDYAHDLYDLPVAQFPEPEEIEIEAKGDGTVPAVRGMSVAEATRVLREAGYLVEVRGAIDSMSIPEGDVVVSRPDAGEALEPGETVRLYPSTGNQPGSGRIVSPTATPTPEPPAPSSPPPPTAEPTPEPTTPPSPTVEPTTPSSPSVTTDPGNSGKPKPKKTPPKPKG